MNAGLSTVLCLCMIDLLIGPASAGAAKTALCDVHRAPCVARTGSGVELAFSLSPRPVRTMVELEYLVVLKKKGRPVTGASLVLDLSMPGMYMGPNQPKLKERHSGSYSGHGIIPRCATGQRTWKASIAVELDGVIESTSFLFEVQ